MNKKCGFTLVELLGVIILLALIVLIAFPSIINVVKKSDNSISEANQALILQAAEQQVDENKNIYTDGTYCIKVEQLIDDGFLIEGISESNGTNLNEQYVKVIVDDSHYQYEIVGTSCSED